MSKKIEKDIERMKNMQKNIVDDVYDEGFYNGIEYCLSILENREAIYKYDNREKAKK